MCDTEHLEEKLRKDYVELWNHYQYAAVSLILKGSEILLERRSSILNDPWAGQFALPGGHYKKSDLNLLKTAIRETEEETGIKLRENQYLGYYGPFSPRNKSDLLVIVHVFKLNDDFDTTLKSSSETEYLGWVNLSKFKGGKMKDGEEIAYVIDEGTVWGLTARIIERFLAICNLNEKENS